MSTSPRPAAADRAAPAPTSPSLPPSPVMPPGTSSAATTTAVVVAAPRHAGSGSATRAGPGSAPPPAASANAAAEPDPVVVVDGPLGHHHRRVAAAENYCGGGGSGGASGAGVAVRQQQQQQPQRSGGHSVAVPRLPPGALSRRGGRRPDEILSGGVVGATTPAPPPPPSAHVASGGSRGGCCDRAAMPMREGKRETREFDDESGRGRDEPASTGDYDSSLVTDANLLNNLFHSSNAPASGEDDSVEEEDRRGNQSQSQPHNGRVIDSPATAQGMQLEESDPQGAAVESNDRARSTSEPGAVSVEVDSNTPHDVNAVSHYPSNRGNDRPYPPATVSNNTVQRECPSLASSSPASAASSSGDSSGSSSGKKPARRDRTGHPKLDQAAVEYLKRWLLSKRHIEQPYPTEQTYAKLQVATGLEKNQLKNWFVNNRRRLWRPMMDELRKRHGLAEREPLPPAVLDALEDEPVPPYGPAAADSVAAAAMMMMTGSGSRAASPVFSSTASALNFVGGVDAIRDAVRDVLDRVIKRVESIEAASKTTEGRIHGGPPPKEHVKFNVGGTVVQIPIGILLKHPRSRLASMARSVMHLAGDVAIPIPRDYAMFSHCVYYACNGRIKLPPNTRRKAFMKEMRYYRIPYDGRFIAGGCAAGPFEPGSRQISPTTVTQLHHHVVGVGVGAGATPVPRPVPSSASFKPIVDSLPQLNGKAEVAGATKPWSMPSPSPLDILSSAVSSSCSLSAGAPKGPLAPNTGSQTPPVRKAVCGKCDACQREDCGRCRTCVDKPKFGGQNKLRKKCLMRKCPNMSPLTPLPAKGGTVSTATATADAEASGQLESLPTPGRKVATPNLAVVAAEQRWHENLEFLRPCIEDGEFINYFVIQEEEIRNRVKNFVKEQRKQYRRWEDGEPTTLTDDRLKLLEEARFPWVFRPSIKLRRYITQEKPTLETVAPVETPVEPTNSAVAEPAISAVVESASPSVTVPANSVEVGPAKHVISPLDLLCSITSQSYAQTSSWYENSIDNEGDSGDSKPPTPLVSQDSTLPDPVRNTYGNAKLKIQRGRGLNCGQCEACSRDECGECKACLDKPKFGGPNTLKRRCFKRRCLSIGPSRDVDTDMEDKPSADKERKRITSKAREEAIMKAELAKIKAELDAKAGGGKYGLNDAAETRSSGTLVSLMREVEEEESDDDEVLNNEDEDKATEGSEAPSEELCSAVYKTALAAGMLDLPRGVTMRPSGKWQVQLYFAGHSRYLGLFNSREEAAVAYEMARECRDSFNVENPSPEQIKRNLELIRKAAFTGGGYKNWRPPIRPGTLKERNDDGMEADPAEAKAMLDAKVRGAKRHSLGSKPPSKSRSQAVEKPQRGNRTVESSDKDEVTSTAAALGKHAPSPWALMEEEEEEKSRKRKYNAEIYEKAKVLAAALPRGITVRPSGKWQVQLYYAGKSRYIGVFDSKLDAAVAYELARECCAKFKDEETSPEQAKQNVILMRKAAFSFSKDDKIKKKKTSVTSLQVTKSGASTSDKSKKRRVSSSQRRLETASQRAEKSNGTWSARTPAMPRIEHDDKEKRGSERPEVAENKKVIQAQVPPVYRPIFLSNPTVKETAAVSSRPLQLPCTREQECCSHEESMSSNFGAVGYKYRKNFTDESGNDLGWYDGEVVDIVAGAEKDRKCFYAADGYIEDLSLAELKVLKEQEEQEEEEQEQEQEQEEEQEEEHLEFGSVGYKFKKQFLDGKWYDGVVVKILKDVENGNGRCVRYPTDGDIEDLSIADLQKLAVLETQKEEEEEREKDEQECNRGLVKEKIENEVEHNDLCETCGKGGELLCCSTCNLVFHLGCARPKLTKMPTFDWSCAFCVASGDTINTSKQEQKKAHLAVQEIRTLKEEARKKEESRRKSPRKRSQHNMH